VSAQPFVTPAQSRTRDTLTLQRHAVACNCSVGRRRPLSWLQTDVQVKCINKRNRPGPHERIQNIGGVNPDGNPWKLSEDAAISGIKAGKWTFFTLLNRVRANVRIGHHLSHEYLTTDPDGFPPNNLLALPECP